MPAPTKAPDPLPLAAELSADGPAPILLRVAPGGYRVAHYAIELSSVPVDFFADPDGLWTYAGLAEAARFDLDQGVGIGALTRDFYGHPEGSAVVTLNAEERPYVAIVECPIAYTYAESTKASDSSAA
jgi:hypothetical protein